MDHRGQDQDIWEEVIEKAGDAEAKANLQPPSYVWEIDSRCPKGHHLSFKRTKRIPSGTTAMRFLKIRKKLGPIPFLPLISFRPKTSKNVTEVDKEII